MDILRSILLSYIIIQVITCYICFVIRYFLIVRQDEKVSGFFILLCLMPMVYGLVILKNAIKLYKYNKYNKEKENK